MGRVGYVVFVVERERSVGNCIGKARSMSLAYVFICARCVGIVGDMTSFVSFWMGCWTPYYYRI